MRNCNGSENKYIVECVFFSQMENCTDGKWRHFVDVHDLELYQSGNEKKSTES